MSREAEPSFDAQREITELKIRTLLKPDVAFQEGVMVYQEFEVGETSVPLSFYPEDIHDEMMAYDHFPSVSVLAEIKAPSLRKEVKKDPHCVVRRRRMKDRQKSESLPDAYKSVALRFDTGEGEVITVQATFLPDNNPQLKVTQKRTGIITPFSDEPDSSDFEDPDVLIRREMTPDDFAFINAFMDQAILQSDVARSKQAVVEQSKVAYTTARKNVTDAFDTLMRETVGEGLVQRAVHFLAPTVVLKKLVESNREASELELLDHELYSSTAVKLVTTGDSQEPLVRYIGMSIKSDTDNTLMPIYLECNILAKEISFRAVYFDKDEGTRWYASTNDLLGLLDVFMYARASKDPQFRRFFNGSHMHPELN
ncbi:MAG TPA: hypothetical protein VJC10_03125 [Patescibacteria group bacterium]|nr:hypothetical protein [Patescibacteria group bacterium]